MGQMLDDVNLAVAEWEASAVLRPVRRCDSNRV